MEIFLIACSLSVSTSICILRSPSANVLLDNTYGYLNEVDSSAGRDLETCMQFRGSRVRAVCLITVASFPWRTSVCIRTRWCFPPERKYA